MEHHKTCTMFKVKHNLQQGCPTQTRCVPRVELDTPAVSAPDLQVYSCNSNSPKTPIIKFRTYEHLLKFFPDAKFNPKFRTCPEFFGRYGNPTIV